jgi:putative Holliday junction resolvase
MRIWNGPLPSGAGLQQGRGHARMWKMRVLAIDLGRKRVGLAVSDVSQTLARPLLTLTVGDAGRVATVMREIDRLAAEDDGLGAIVVGVPTRLDGTANETTALAQAFVAALRAKTRLPVVVEDERLTSIEAESRLALRERDWRARKQRLDAAAAAVSLQDYLDRQRR